MPLNKIKKHLNVKESDVTIISEKNEYIEAAISVLNEERLIIESTIKKYPKFKTSFIPYSIPNPPDIIERMQLAAEICDVGPMASIAGALADKMSDSIKKKGAKIAVIENGGEIIIDSVEDIHIALYSMTTALKAKMGFIFKGGNKPIGVGTSSGTFGHAFSFGDADTVTVFGDNAAIGDAAATRVANAVKGEDIENSIGKGLEVADSLEKISGTFITRGKLVGKSGSIPELIAIEDGFEDNLMKSKTNSD
ncbi:MAG: UPF0280 family protein [archaeon]|nr:UPF0280 family protein [archaeon]